MFDNITLSILALGVGAAWLLLMAAMAGRMNQLAKTYRAQLHYDLKMAEIDKMKQIRKGVNVEQQQ